MGKRGMSKKLVGLPIVQSMDKILLLNHLQAAAEEGDHAKDEKNAGLGNLEGFNSYLRRRKVIIELEDLRVELAYWESALIGHVLGQLG
ncbi:hypothetical protein Ancab_008751 [Ancistrocladus abbreviatus]